MSTACACGVNLVPVLPSGEVQSGLQGSPAMWTQSQKLQIRNACCNVTCDAFCASQPAACQAGGSPLMSDGLTGSSSTNKKPPTRPTMRGATGMRSAIGGGRWCNCDITIPLANGGTKRTQGTKVCRNNPDECCGSCRPAVPNQKSQTSQSTEMKKATGRPPAPKGFHYMPDGSLMRDEDHKGFRNQATRSRFSTYWGGLKIK